MLVLIFFISVFLRAALSVPYSVPCGFPVVLQNLFFVGKLPDDQQRNDTADSGQTGVSVLARCACGIRRGTFLFLI